MRGEEPVLWSAYNAEGLDAHGNPTTFKPAVEIRALFDPATQDLYVPRTYPVAEGDAFEFRGERHVVKATPLDYLGASHLIAPLRKE